jgi:hypothetical protein
MQSFNTVNFSDFKKSNNSESATYKLTPKLTSKVVLRKKTDLTAEIIDIKTKKRLP